MDKITNDTETRAPLISIKDRKVTIKTFQVSMSRYHRFVMLADLFTISWVTGITVFMSMDENLSRYAWIVCSIGFLVLIFAVGKTIVDFRNWMYTMNSMLAQIGEFYLKDIAGICQDFAIAGAKVAADEIEKADGDKAIGGDKNAYGEVKNP